jgi:RNA polymerase sigma-70 factor (ECF subfamily)
MSPEEIIEQALAEYELPLMRYAREITGNPDSARDAVQETFLRLSRQDVVSLEPRLAPWLFHVCRNCSLDFRRKIIRMPTVPDSTHIQSESSEPDPSSATVAKEDYSLIRSLVDSLPSRHRELVVLRFNSDLSYQQISEVTGLTVSNVGAHLHAAIGKLRRMWNESAKNPALLKSYG